MTSSARYRNDDLVGISPAALAAAAVKVALLHDTYTPDVDTDEFWADISAHETSGTNYTAGGVLLSGKVAAQGGTFAYFDSNDPAWTGATINFRYAVWYVWTGNPATSPLIGYLDLGSEQGLVGATFTLNIPPPDVGALLRVETAP